MPHHAFIDESGTQEHQQVMTVALVVFEGARSAENLHKKLVKAVFPEPKARGLAEKERMYASYKLHYYDMDENQKLKLGSVLAQSNIRTVITHYWHTDDSITHDHRFYMYKQLVKTSIDKAFSIFDDLAVSVAKQGGWPEYGDEFLAELRLIPESHTKAGKYKRGEFFFSSAVKPGQQIADFYASSSRHHIMSRVCDNMLDEPFERIKHQVHCIEEVRPVEQLEKPMTRKKVRTKPHFFPILCVCSTRSSPKVSLWASLIPRRGKFSLMTHLSCPPIIPN